MTDLPEYYKQRLKELAVKFDDDELDQLYELEEERHDMWTNLAGHQIHIEENEKLLQQYIDWQTSRVRSKVKTDIGQEAYLSLIKLKELGLAKIESSNGNNETKKAKP